MDKNKDDIVIKDLIVDDFAPFVHELEKIKKDDAQKEQESDKKEK